MQNCLYLIRIDTIAAITGGGISSSISFPISTPNNKFNQIKFRKMAITTEIIHAINFSGNEKFVLVNTDCKNQAINKDGIEAKKEKMDTKKNAAIQ